MYALIYVRQLIMLYLHVFRLVFMLFFFILCHCNAFQIKMSFKQFKMTRGSRLSGHVTLTYHVSSTIKCAKLCAQEMSCISYNLIRENATKVCELNSNGLVDVFVTDVNSNYFGL